MKYLSLTVAAAALILTPTTANAQFFGGFDNSTVLGSLAGAGIGGAIGSNLAGSGNRDEGTAIGAAIGGLAGAAYGNSRSNYFGNPYAGSFNPGFTGNSLLGTAVGAGIGGAIGSNLAGSGVRQEGTAIGAVLGGLAGNALSSRSRYGNSGFGNAGFNGGFVGANSRYGNGAPLLGTGFIPPSYGPNFGAPAFGPGPIAPAPFVPAPQFGATLPPFPTGGTSFVPGGFVNAGTFANTTTILPPAMPTVISAPAPAPAPVYQPLSTAFTGVTIAAPNVTLAGPTLRPSVLRTTSNRYGDSIGSTVTQSYVGSTGISAPIVLRRAPKTRLVVIERDTYASTPSVISTHSHNDGFTSNYASSFTSGHSHSASAPASSGQSIHADTVNINYGNNSQVGTTNSNNGSTLGGHSHGAGGFTSAPSGAIDFGDGIGDGTWGHHGGAVNTGSYTVGTTSVLGGYDGYSDMAPVYSTGSTRYSSASSSHAGNGPKYAVSSGESFTVPSASGYSATCTAGSAGCGASTASYDWSTPSYGTHTDSYGSHGSHSTKTYSGTYKFCDSDKIYNDDGAQLVNASPVCR